MSKRSGKGSSGRAAKNGSNASKGAAKRRQNTSLHSQPVPLEGAEVDAFVDFVVGRRQCHPDFLATTKQEVRTLLGSIASGTSKLCAIQLLDGPFAANDKSGNGAAVSESDWNPENPSDILSLFAADKATVTLRDLERDDLLRLVRTYFGPAHGKATGSSPEDLSSQVAAGLEARHDALQRRQDRLEVLELHETACSEWREDARSLQSGGAGDLYDLIRDSWRLQSAKWIAQLLQNKCLEREQRILHEKYTQRKAGIGSRMKRNRGQGLTDDAYDEWQRFSDKCIAEQNDIKERQHHVLQGLGRCSKQWEHLVGAYTNTWQRAPNVPFDEVHQKEVSNFWVKEKDAVMSKNAVREADGTVKLHIDDMRSAAELMKSRLQTWLNAQAEESREAEKAKTAALVHMEEGWSESQSQNGKTVEADPASVEEEPPLPEVLSTAVQKISTDIERMSEECTLVDKELENLWRQQLCDASVASLLELIADPSVDTQRIEEEYAMEVGRQQLVESLVRCTFRDALAQFQGRDAELMAAKLLDEESERQELKRKKEKEHADKLERQRQKAREDAEARQEAKRKAEEETVEKAKVAQANMEVQRDRKREADARRAADIEAAEREAAVRFEVEMEARRLQQASIADQNKVLLENWDNGGQWESQSRRKKNSADRRANHNAAGMVNGHKDSRGYGSAGQKGRGDSRGNGKQSGDRRGIHTMKQPPPSNGNSGCAHGTAIDTGAVKVVRACNEDPGHLQDGPSTSTVAQGGTEIFQRAPEVAENGETRLKSPTSASDHGLERNQSDLTGSALETRLDRAAAVPTTRPSRPLNPAAAPVVPSTKLSGRSFVCTPQAQPVAGIRVPTVVTSQQLQYATSGVHPQPLQQNHIHYSAPHVSTAPGLMVTSPVVKLPPEVTAAGNIAVVPFVPLPVPHHPFQTGQMDQAYRLPDSMVQLQQFGETAVLMRTEQEHAAATDAVPGAVPQPGASQTQMPNSIDTEETEEVEQHQESVRVDAAKGEVSAWSDPTSRVSNIMRGPRAIRHEHPQSNDVGNPTANANSSFGSAPVKQVLGGSWQPPSRREGSSGRGTGPTGSSTGLSRQKLAQQMQGLTLDELLMAENSPLGSVDLADVLTPRAFAGLSSEDRKTLLAYLPTVDKDTSVAHGGAMFNHKAFNEACRIYSELLRAGMFDTWTRTPAWRETGLGTEVLAYEEAKHSTARCMTRF